MSNIKMPTGNKTLPHIKHTFIHSAALEMVKSIHLIAKKNTEHPAYEKWEHIIEESISSKLKKEIDFFSEHFAKWSFIMDLVAELAYKEKEFDDLEIILAKMNKISDYGFAVFFLGVSTYESDYSKVKQYMTNPELTIENNFEGMSGELAVEDIRYCLQNIKEIRERLTWTMRRYWQEIFEIEWNSIREYLKSVVKRGNSLIERNGVINYICTFHDKIYIQGERLYFDKEPGFSIELSKIREVVITPSVFTYPLLYGNIFGNKVYIALNLNYNAVKINENIPAAVLELMHILSDETRYKIIYALWQKDMTPTELTELLTFSMSTISLHLKMMREAGIVETKKENNHIYYSLIRHPFFHIQRELLDSFEK